MLMPTSKNKTKTKKYNLDWRLIIILGAIGAIRPLVHDIPALSGKEPLQGLVAISVFTVMLVTPLVKKVPNIFPTFVAIGGVYGLFSAFVHQAMWNSVFDGGYPSLGADATFEPPVLVLRFFAFIATIVTSILTGALLGVMAYLASKLTYDK